MLATDRWLNRERRCFSDPSAQGRDLCQSEVENLSVPPLRNEDVGWFNVTVHDASRMRGVQRVGDLDCEREHVFHIQWLPSDPHLQSHPIQKLHGNESVAVLLANVINRADVRVIECGRSLRLTLETGERLWVLG